MATCKACYFIKDGRCRRNPPTVLMLTREVEVPNPMAKGIGLNPFAVNDEPSKIKRVEVSIHAEWPPVPMDGWCGEFDTFPDSMSAPGIAPIDP